MISNTPVALGNPYESVVSTGKKAVPRKHPLDLVSLSLIQSHYTKAPWMISQDGSAQSEPQCLRLIGRRCLASLEESLYEHLIIACIYTD